VFERHSIKPSPRVLSNAECFDCFGGGDVFDDIGIRPTSMDQLAAGCIDKRTVRDVTGSEFHLLAECTNIY
jgi:hypothetical protein